MIRRLDIQGFKRFAKCSIEMAPLTVLTGTNGAGKTSTIHALLLARLASMPSEGYAEQIVVPLNGPFGLELGTAQDVLNINTALEHSRITIEILGDESSQEFEFDATDEQRLYLPVKRSSPRASFWALNGPNRFFTYLCAERLGPRETLRASALHDDHLGVGVQGEFSAQILAIHGMREKIDPAKRHPERRDDVDALLKYQVEAWLSDVVRPVEIDTVWFPNTSVTSLQFRSPGDVLWVRAPNMGFGVSYALPIILAGLFAPWQKPSMLIVENPEAHLHPAGQSRIGVFLAQMAASGVQVLLETHSDHVLNGIRRAIGEHQVLKAADAVTHFFDMETDADPRITTLRFTETGGMSEWPRRFFDQYQLDVAALTRVRRPKRTGG